MKSNVSLRSVLVAIGVVLVSAIVTAQMSFFDPNVNTEFESDAGISATVHTDADEVGKTVIFKVREGHVFGAAESGTVYQSDSATVSSEEEASATLAAPTGGWPQIVGMKKAVHIEAKCEGATTVNRNIYIKAIAP